MLLRQLADLLIKRYNVPMPKGVTSPQVKREIAERKAISMLAQGMSQADVVRATGLVQSKISRLASTWSALLDYIADLKEFRTSRLDIIDAAQAKVLQFALDEQKLRKANLYSLSALLRNLYDISRLEQGKSTDITEQRVAVVHLDKYAATDIDIHND